MPLMSEGKAGPSRAKLRAIWRAMKRKRDSQAAHIAARPLASVSAANLAADTLAMADAWLSGESTPVGITTAAWRAVCAEMNARPATAGA